MLTQLTQKAEQANKIKGFDTSRGQSVKFFSSQVETVELTTSDYETFLSHLKATGWRLAPQVTSGGFVATRPASLIGQNALPVWACNNRNIEDMLG